VDGADIDDLAAAFVVAHDPTGLLSAQEGRPEINREHPVPILLLELQDRAGILHGRVVDEDVQSGECSFDLQKQFANLAGLRQFGCDLD